MDLEKRVSEIYNNLDDYHIDKEPLRASKQIIRETLIITDNYEGIKKAEILYQWVFDNIKTEINNVYNKNEASKYKYKTAIQTFNNKIGMCVDNSFLFTTMARILKYKSGIVNILPDDEKENIRHICSFLEYENNIMLVDTTLENGFGIKHKLFRLYNNNSDIIDLYKNLMIPINLGADCDYLNDKFARILRRDRIEAISYLQPLENIRKDHITRVNVNRSNYSYNINQSRRSPALIVGLLTTLLFGGYYINKDYYDIKNKFNITIDRTNNFIEDIRYNTSNIINDLNFVSSNIINDLNDKVKSLLFTYDPFFNNNYKKEVIINKECKIYKNQYEIRQGSN